MNPGRKRWLVRLAILLLVGLGGLLWSIGKLGRDLTIENRSAQTITELKITIGGQSRTFTDVKPGGEASASSPANDGELPFTVEGKLADGNVFRLKGQFRDSLHYLLLPGGQLQLRPKRWFG